MNGTFYVVLVSRLSLASTTTEHASDQLNKPQESQLVMENEEADPTSNFYEYPGEYESIYFFNLSTQKVEWEMHTSQTEIRGKNVHLLYIVTVFSGISPETVLTCYK